MDIAVLPVLIGDMQCNPYITVVSVWMITMMALDRFGAITSHNYMTKSSGGHYRGRIWIITLSVWLCAYFLTRQMWVNTEYTEEGQGSPDYSKVPIIRLTPESGQWSPDKGDIATCKMNWGLPVDEDIGDFVRDENDCHSCPVDGDVLEQCAESHVDHDQSPVKILALTELGWDTQTCLRFYYPNATDGNSTSADYESPYSDYGSQELSASEMSADSSLYNDSSDTSAESLEYTDVQNYLCGYGL